MYIKQSDLLWGLDNQFIKEFIESAMKKTHPEGFKLFNAGDPADFFYIMMKGSIRLSVGKQNQTTYLVEHAAECLKESMVMIFAKEFVQGVTDADPVNGMRFYRRLARMLGNRLIHSYQLIADGVTEGIAYPFAVPENSEAQQNR